MTFVQNVSIFGAKYLIYVLLLVTGVWYLLLKDRAKQKDILIFAIATLPLAFLVSLLAAKLYLDPRPFVTGHFTPLIAHGTDNGFPSDHTLLSAVVASIVWRYDRRVGYPLFVLTLVVGLSRMYVGVHHLVDILGSIFIAIMSAVIISRVLKIKHEKTKEPQS